MTPPKPSSTMDSRASATSDDVGPTPIAVGPGVLNDSASADAVALTAEVGARRALCLTDLPAEILGLIADEVFAQLSILAFGLVCKLFRSLSLERQFGRIELRSHSPRELDKVTFHPAVAGAVETLYWRSGYSNHYGFAARLSERLHQLPRLRSLIFTAAADQAVHPAIWEAVLRHPRIEFLPDIPLRAAAFHTSWPDLRSLALARATPLRLGEISWSTSQDEGGFYAREGVRNLLSDLNASVDAVRVMLGDHPDPEPLPTFLAPPPAVISFYIGQSTVTDDSDDDDEVELDSTYPAYTHNPGWFRTFLGPLLNGTRGVETLTFVKAAPLPFRGLVGPGAPLGEVSSALLKSLEGGPPMSMALGYDKECSPINLVEFVLKSGPYTKIEWTVEPAFLAQLAEAYPMLRELQLDAILGQLDDLHSLNSFRFLTDFGLRFPVQSLALDELDLASLLPRATPIFYDMDSTNLAHEQHRKHVLGMGLDHMTDENLELEWADALEDSGPIDLEWEDLPRSLRDRFLSLFAPLPCLSSATLTFQDDSSSSCHFNFVIPSDRSVPPSFGFNLVDFVRVLWFADPLALADALPTPSSLRNKSS